MRRCVSTCSRSESSSQGDARRGGPWRDGYFRRAWINSHKTGEGRSSAAPYGEDTVLGGFGLDLSVPCRKELSPLHFAGLACHDASHLVMEAVGRAKKCCIATAILIFDDRRF